MLTQVILIPSCTASALLFLFLQGINYAMNSVFINLNVLPQIILEKKL